MKKRLLFFTLIALFYSVSSASCAENYKKVFTVNNCECQNQCEKEYEKDKCQNSCDDKKNCEENSQDKTTCDNCEIEQDDEYCMYNQCFFDKKYKKMKKELCLTRRQENCIDRIYKAFKADYEAICCKYRNDKNKLLEMIECDKDCQKEQIKKLKEYKKEAKEVYKDFKEEVKEQLCKNQRSDFRKFQRKEKRKMKKIVKYSAIYKFPCVNCCNK